MTRADLHDPRLTSLTPDQCALIAQIAPVLLLALVVERREVAGLTKNTAGLVTWRRIVTVYGALLAFAMIGRVSWSDEGPGGFFRFLLTASFWIGVGAAA